MESAVGGANNKRRKLGRTKQESRKGKEKVEVGVAGEQSENAGGRVQDLILRSRCTLRG